MEGPLNAYKFLGPGARGIYSGFRWPAPRNGPPGDWVDVRGALEPGSNGVHALRTRRLVDWIDDELWLVELADEVEEIDDMLVALVTEYLDGTLSRFERVRFERHVAVCPPCRAHLDQMRETIRASGRLTEQSISEVARDDLLAAFADWSDG